MVLMIDEKELVIKLGMINFGFEVAGKEELARSSFGYILNDVNDLKERYIKLGFHLEEFNRNEYYKVFGFSTFQEFCNENMPISYQTCKHCMNVFLNFAEDGTSCKKMYISKKYKDFSFSQLVEMLPIDSRRREIIKSDWSVEKIRRYKKGLKKHDKSIQNVPDRDDIQPTEEEIFFQVLQQPDVMKILGKALESRYGENCMQNFKSTAKTATFEVAGEKYCLQLNKIN